MNHPNDLSYSKSHEWVKMDGDTAIIGISDFAQDALGDVVFVNLPAEGDDVTAAALIDRLVHHAEILALKGDSYRLRDRDLARPTSRDD